MKHITLLQGQLFPRNSPGLPSGAQAAATIPTATQAAAAVSSAGVRQGAIAAQGSGKPPPTAGEAFAYVQSPVLFDPNLNMNYVATTTFSPAPHSANIK